MAWYEIPGAEQDVALCTCARLSRNLEAFPFPARLEPAGAKEVISAGGAVLTENGFTAIDFAEISRTAACALVEKCYAGPEFIRESLPHALSLNEPCGISAMLCGQDHVRLRCIRPGLAVRDAYAGVSGVEGQLDARFDLAFDERLGYLTHDPGELGTGLCVSVLLFLPALEAGKAIGTAQRIKSRRPSGQQLMGVALVPHIKDDLILRGVKDTVQRHRQLHQPQIGGQVPAGVRNALYDEFPQLSAQLLELFLIHPPQKSRVLDLFYIHSVGSFFR